ncbi:MAG: ferrous iron transport protein A [Candidatus Sumerlaeia bacterium]|nr:ferrous iron transport protein A [Candidatus Sumerlaeia bacterium]
MPTLDELQTGEAATVTALEGDDTYVQRLMELGLIEGVRVEFLRRAPMGDPLEIRIDNTFRLSLRREDARRIAVERAS